MRIIGHCLILSLTFGIVGCDTKVDQPTKKSTLNGYNEKIFSCAALKNEPYSKYSLSPSGRYFLTSQALPNNHKHGYLKDGVLYDGLKILELTEVKDLKNGPIETLLVSAFIDHVGFSWDRYDNLYYKPTKYPAEFEKNNTLENKKENVFFNDIDSGVDLYDQNSIYAKSLLKTQREINFQSWRPNVYGEKTFRLVNGEEGKAPNNLQLFSELDVKLPKGSQRKNFGIIPILAYDFLDEVALYPSQYFRSSTNRDSVSIDSDESISHFFYKSNVDREFPALFKATENNGTIDHEVIHSPNKTSISHVSLNRNGSEVYWAVTSSVFPEYHFFSDKAKSLFNLIDIGHPHISKIVSMSSDEKRVIVQRESMRYGIEYLLVNNKKVEILSQCWTDSFEPWADVEGLEFRASDGQTVYGYIYRPPNVTKPAPTIIYAHGGPSTREYISTDNLYYKSLVDLGYVVVTVNYRGSTGFGRTYREAGWKNFERSRLDLIEAGHFVTKFNYVDGDRLAIMGNSYGGFLSLSTSVLDDHPFKAAISRNGMADLVSFFERPYKTVRGRKLKYNQESYIFGNINDPKDRAYLMRNSAISGTKDTKTPLLIVHAKEDDKVPLYQSEEFVEKAFKDNLEASIRFLIIPGGHYISELETLENYIKEVDIFLRSTFTK